MSVHSPKLASVVRSQIIEALRLAASFDDQFKYQKECGIAAPVEVICLWEDFYAPDNSDIFCVPNFSIEEISALAAFNESWNSVCARLDEPLPPLEKLTSSEPWNDLRKSAEQALEHFRA